MKIKICGLKTLEDALAAVDAGADLLGFNFYPPSPRSIRPEACAAITAHLPARSPVHGRPVIKVGVFVNSPPEMIRQILTGCGLDLAQLSGDEPPEDLAVLGDKAFKALRPRDLHELEGSIRRYPHRAAPPAWLVDAYRPGEWGGTGQRADWSLAGSLAAHTPILLAGGLNPGNVASAIEQVRPWGVDVASGVESAPGRKDPLKMAAFIEAARRAKAVLSPGVDPITDH